MTELYIGLMSGTSVDSIDSVLINFNNNSFEILEVSSSSIEETLKDRIFNEVNKDKVSKVEIEKLDLELGKAFGNAAKKLLQKAEIDSCDVVAIGSHGQTIKHAPNAPSPFSLQIGSPKEIAHITNIKTVADFRTADIAAGGQGAPLAPLFHSFILKKNKVSEALVINIGGISNLTYFNDSTESIIAYDCGPGNCLIDTWSRSNNRGDFDAEGVWASSGKVEVNLLKEMLNDDYFSKHPPKSTGTDYFNLKWINKKISEFSEVSTEDIQATLTELSAQTIFKELKDLKVEKKPIYLCGGGIHNLFLVKRLEELVENQIFSTSEIGIDADFLEACCFAWLAKERLKKTKFDLSKITGSKEEISLGEIWEVT